jgi:hypothetical protein
MRCEINHEAAQTPVEAPERIIQTRRHCTLIAERLRMDFLFISIAQPAHRFAQGDLPECHLFVIHRSQSFRTGSFNGTSRLEAELPGTNRRLRVYEELMP